MYQRVLLDRLKKRVDFKKAIILYGSRQVGKTTLVRQLANDLTLPFEYYNADDLITRNLWSQENMVNLRASFGSAKVVILDEAQMIPDIGIIIKQLIDLQTGIQFILTGSSSFDIANKTQEPLTGRKWEFLLYPVGYSEIVKTDGMAEAMRKMPFNLIFGGYPDVVSNPSDAVDLIKHLSNSYLYKDVLALSGIQKPQALQRILQALAYQVGGEVSLNEISRLVGVDVKTVDNYIYLLEQIFVVFRLNVLSRNERNELNSKSKIYFYDNGVLNALTGNFTPPEGRQDIGALWENYLISERKKLLDYHGFYGKTYFWRNSLQAEIDYVEVIDGKVYGYEFKWNPKAKTRYPKNFLDIYSPELTETIHRDNYMNWLINYPY